MTDITTTDARFSPIRISRRTYITSTLLHKQKRDAGMQKYEEVETFNMMIREMECYSRLYKSNDILVIDKAMAEETGCTEFTLLIKANSYNPLLLLSPIARTEIEHLLDNGQSKTPTIQSSTVSAVVNGGLERQTGITTTTSQFVSPSARPELGGELGLDLHEIAKSLNIPFGHAKTAFEKNINDYTGIKFSTHVNQGPVRGMVQVDSYVLSVEDAKFFVAGYNNEIGKAYRRHLIQCESALKQVGVDLTKVFVSPTVGIMFLKEVEKKNEIIKLLGEDKAALEKQKVWIADKKTATAMATASNLAQYIKRNGLPVPNYAKTLELPETITFNDKVLEKMKTLEEQVEQTKQALEKEQTEKNRIMTVAKQIQADLQAKEAEVAFYSQKPNRPILWERRADVLVRWGIKTAGRGQSFWKEFTAFCQGLSPDVSRYNQDNRQVEFRIDLAEKHRKSIVGWFKKQTEMVASGDIPF